MGLGAGHTTKQGLNLVKHKYYITEVNYTKHYTKMIDILIWDRATNYEEKYKTAFKTAQQTDIISYYADTDKHHKWIC